MGEFLSRAGVRWRVEILQEASAPFGIVGQLTFEAEEALVIDWPRTSKEEVLCGSEATIRLESPGDRTYEDLYSVDPGRIRMDVYREGVLYWSGLLDPEFYEEPYERLSHYVVPLTFSDFGILSRLKYRLSGLQSLSSILDDALDRSQLNYVRLDADAYISTCLGGDKAVPSALSVNSENFVDEDGEECTLSEVLTGIFQPLGLRLVQRSGVLWLYDLNGLYGHGDCREVVWSGSHQTLGVDKVFNNVKLSFSAYGGDGTIIDGSVKYLGGVDPGNVYTGYGVGPMGQDAGVNTYYPDYGSDYQPFGSGGDGRDYYSFSIFRSWSSSDGVGVTKGEKALFFHLEPLFGGEKSDGVCWGFRPGLTGLDSEASSRRLVVVGNSSDPDGRDVVFRSTRRAWLPPLSSGDAARFRLRLELSILFDTRYNPFEESGDDNERGNSDWAGEMCGYLQLPFMARLYDASGVLQRHYTNLSVCTSHSHTGMNGSVLGSWQSGGGDVGCAWLEWYDGEDANHVSACQGWKTNRHAIGLPLQKVRKSLLSVPGGQYLPYPESGGWLEVTLYSGFRSWDFTGRGVVDTSEELGKNLRWQLYKDLKVSVVNNDMQLSSLKVDDVEYSGRLNAHAKEELELETICGTLTSVSPTSKGSYYRSQDLRQVETMNRGGVEDHPEKLLIGTLYSQFASRKTVLSGEMAIESVGLCSYTERNQDGKVFLLCGDRQDVIMDTTEAEIVEYCVDEYEGEEA